MKIHFTCNMIKSILVKVFCILRMIDFSFLNPYTKQKIKKYTASFVTTSCDDLQYYLETVHFRQLLTFLPDSKQCIAYFIVWLY